MLVSDALRQSARQHGSVLVLVLAVTSIVGIIGMSSLLAVRLQHRDVQTRTDATHAQLLADTGLQLVHAQLGANPDWRSDHTHNVWSADLPLGSGGTLRYKLTDVGDDNDADLADDDNDPVRLTVRVAHSRAVRLASIRIAGGEPLGPELIANGDMEAGTYGYGKTAQAGYFNASSFNPHAGSLNLIFQGRLSSIDAWKQNLGSGSIKTNTTYRLSVWVRLENNDAQVVLGLHNKNPSFSDTQEKQAPATTAWQNIQLDLTPTFSFTPSSTYVFGHTATGNQDIHLDDLSLREVLTAGLPIVLGSYRRQLDD